MQSPVLRTVGAGFSRLAGTQLHLAPNPRAWYGF
jgi:hypothetical protein